jgi:hypothetical protein
VNSPISRDEDESGFNDVFSPAPNRLTTSPHQSGKVIGEVAETPRKGLRTATGPPSTRRSGRSASQSPSPAQVPSPNLGKGSGGEEQDSEPVVEAADDESSAESPGPVEGDEDEMDLGHLILGHVSDAKQLDALVSEYVDVREGSAELEDRDDTLVYSTHKWEIFKDDTRETFRTSDRHAYMDVDDVAMFWTMDCPRGLPHKPTPNIKISRNRLPSISMFE